MRPWTLNAADVTAQNPLLSDLGLSHTSAIVQLGCDRGPASYSSSWEWYIKGNVVSELARRYIVNMLGSTTARALDMPESDNDSDSDDEPDAPQHIGTLELVAVSYTHLTLPTKRIV